VTGFVAGCAAGAVLEVKLGFWALALPVVLSALAVPLGRFEKLTAGSRITTQSRSS
jgi:uncharacterized membrane protein